MKLWAGLGCGPLAWCLQLAVSYPIAQLSCHAGFEGQHTMTIHAIAAAALAATGAGAFALLPLRDVGVERVRFMARLGLLSCALFALVVIATWVPPFILHNCES